MLNPALKMIPECIDCSLPFSQISYVCQKCIDVTETKFSAHIQQRLQSLNVPTSHNSLECVLVTPHSSLIFENNLHSCENLGV